MMDQKQVLIWVGMQVDLLPGGSAEVPQSPLLVKAFHEISSIPQIDLVLAANFHLPADHASFAGNHLWRKPGQVVQVEGIATELKTMYGVQGSFGAEFLPGMRTTLISQVFFLGTQPSQAPHSAFFDLGGHATGLEAYLKAHQPCSVLLAGMPLENELKNTALDAQRMGYPTSVIGNACLARNPAVKDQVLEELATAGITILNLSYERAET